MAGGPAWESWGCERSPLPTKFVCAHLPPVLSRGGVSIPSFPTEEPNQDVTDELLPGAVPGCGWVWPAQACAYPRGTLAGAKNATLDRLAWVLVLSVNDTFDYFPVGDKDMVQMISLHILVKKSS